jgi:hypothetical protein
VLASVDPSRGQRKDAKARSNKVLGRLGVRDIELTEHEQIIAAEVIHPDEISVRFQGEPGVPFPCVFVVTWFFLDVGGLDHIIDQLRESVIYPLTLPQLFESAAGLFSAPKGVLLYGPPG